MSTPVELTVATYNIKLGIHNGLGAIAGVIAEHGPVDILAVQEIGHHWLMGPEGDSPARLATLLEMPHLAFVPTIEESRPDGPAARYGHALYSRWPIDDRQLIDLPRHQDEPRRLLRSRISTPGPSLEVLSTHLSHLPEDRPDQGLFIRRWLQEQPLKEDARFLLGDLNAPPTETWLAGMLHDWIDADADTGRPTFPAHDPARRIDYVLAQHARLASTRIPRPDDVSDHHPVLTRWHLEAT